MFEVTRYDAGRSAKSKYDQLAQDWMRRTFGKRTFAYAWTIVVLLVMLATQQHLSSRWALAVGFGLGLVGGTLVVLPAAMLPSYIANWQLGAWGEENTGRELRKLSSREWTVRHDLRWGDRANHDHVIAGPAVYCLNSKHPDDSRVTVEDGAIRVERRGDSDDGYLADRWIPKAATEAFALRCELNDALGFPVHVYPVVVIWAGYEDEYEWVSAKGLDVAVVRGDKLIEFISERKADILDPVKRCRVQEYVASMPSAAPRNGWTRRVLRWIFRP